MNNVATTEINTIESEEFITRFLSVLSYQELQIIAKQILGGEISENEYSYILFSNINFDLLLEKYSKDRLFLDMLLDEIDLRERKNVMDIKFFTKEEISGILGKEYIK